MNPPPLRPFRRSLGTLALLTLLATGCRSTSTHVGTFATAAATASQSIREALVAVDQTTVDRKLSDIAISTNRPVITAKTFTGLFDAETQLKPRLAVLRQMEAYANALGELATADYRAGIDAAAKDLYGALGGLAKTYGQATGKTLPVSNDALMIAATAVDAIGKAVVEAKRQRAIRKIVIQFDPVVQQVSGYLARELPALYSDFVKANLEAVGDDLASAYKREAPGLTYQERMAALRLIGRAKLAPATAPAMFTAAGQAAAEIGAAHAALKQAATNKQLTSQELVARVKELTVLGESVKDFYEQLRRKE